MLRLLADENFNGAIVRGLLLREPLLDIVRIQDLGLTETDDASVLVGDGIQSPTVMRHRGPLECESRGL